MFSQNGQNSEKYQKAVGTFSNFLTLTSYKMSEKSDERFLRKIIFEFSVKKRKRHLLTHFFIFQNKNQKIPMCGFGENLEYGGEERPERQQGLIIIRWGLKHKYANN